MACSAISPSVASPAVDLDVFFMAPPFYNIVATVVDRLNPLCHRLSCRLTPVPHSRHPLPKAAPMTLTIGFTAAKARRGRKPTYDSVLRSLRSFAAHPIPLQNTKDIVTQGDVSRTNPSIHPQPPLPTSLLSSRPLFPDSVFAFIPP